MQHRLPPVTSWLRGRQGAALFTQLDSPTGPANAQVREALMCSFCVLTMQVGNLNFAPFARLCAGEFGGAPLDPGHTLLVVNPTWTRSADIGQVRSITSRAC